MKKAILFICLVAATFGLKAQSQLENCYFAAWQDIPSTTAPAGVYQQPVGNTWATSNEASMLFLALPSVKKTSDSYMGEYAAMIQTVALGTTKGAGTLFTGKFKLDIINPLNSTKFGVPFTDRPVYLKGYYKYLPVNNDSCRIASYLTRWNSGTHRRDTIAAATISRAQSMLTVSQYTQFNIIYTYYSELSPDSITVIFASSADGANFNASIGSTLYIDEISLEYFPLSINRLNDTKWIMVYPNPVGNQLNFKSDQIKMIKSVKIYNYLGKMVQLAENQNSTTSMDISALAEGLYFYSLELFDGSTEGGKFVKK